MPESWKYDPKQPQAGIDNRRRDAADFMAKLEARGFKLPKPFIPRKQAPRQGSSSEHTAMVEKLKAGRENIMNNSQASGNHVYMRKEGTGLGWGDYDMFHEWQATGRQVTSEMVPNRTNAPLVWCEPFIMVPNDGSAKMLVDTPLEKRLPARKNELCDSDGNPETIFLVARKREAAMEERAGEENREMS
jgi:hypothetical protein